MIVLVLCSTGVVVHSNKYQCVVLVSNEMINIIRFIHGEN